MNTKRKTSISPRQIKAIHAALHKLGIDDSTYRCMLWERHRVQSCKALSWREAEELLESLNGKPCDVQRATCDVRSKNRWAELDGRPGMATGAQCRMIEAIWAEVSRAATPEDRERALTVFMRRIVGVDHFRWLKGWQVQMLVKALNAMKANKKEEPCA